MSTPLDLGGALDGRLRSTPVASPSPSSARRALRRALN
jgi:hypothetical protein